MDAPVAFRRFIVLCLGLIVAAAAVAGEVAWKPGDLVRREPALTRAKHEAAAWQARLPAAGARLFYSPTELAAWRERRAHATGRAREWFEELDAAVQQVVATPVPVYRPPEELVTPTHTLYDARAELWQRDVGNNIVCLCIALFLRDDPAVRAKLHEMVLAACRYPQWGFNWNGVANRDLACAHEARAIAMAYDTQRALWSAEEKKLIRDVIAARVATLHESLYHDGPFFSNHNHVAASAVGLCGVAFLGEIPAAEEWIATALLSFDNAFHFFPADGASAEGVPYGSYSLTAIMEFIEGTRRVLGTDAYYRQPHLRNYIAYRVHAATPGFAGVLPWGDSPPRDYYGPQHILYRLAAEYGDGAGVFLANHLPFSPQFRPHSGPDMIGWTALWFDPRLAERAPVALDRFSPGADLVSTRSGWGADDYLLAIKSGYTNRYHSHLDAGALAWSSGADWLLTTPGYGAGSGGADYWDRLGGKRWEFFSNATASETTLLVNGHNQAWGENDRGTIDEFAATAGWCWTGIDLSGVYPEARHARREVLHRRGDYALVLDEVSADRPLTVEWLAQVAPAVLAPGERVLLRGRAGSLEVRPVSPADAHFAARAPTQPHVDVDPKQLATYALRAQGTDVKFAVALLPGRAGEASPVQRVEEHAIEGARGFVVSGAGWRDDIVLAPAGKTRAWQNGVLAAVARLVVVRSGAQGAERMLLVGARRVSLPGIAMTFATPTAAEFHRTANGEWEAEFAAPASITR